MIELGVCTAHKNILKAAELGFDYVEYSLAGLCGMSDPEFEQMAAEVDAAPIKVRAYNGMLPGELKVTGPDVDRAAIQAYLQKMLPRAKRLGGRVIVFGSGAARRVPDGFPMDRAWRQVAEYLAQCEPVAAECGIDIAIEPLRRVECNILNLVAEGMAVASMVNLPHINVLGDTHHMVCVHEPLEALTYAGARLKHVHVSHSMGDAGRVFPYPGDGEDYRVLFDTLKAAGYEGGVSIEAGCEDFERDGALAIEVLRAALA